MKEKRSTKLRGITLPGASYFLGLICGASAFLALPYHASADQNPLEAGSITINPASGPVTLDLIGPDNISGDAPDAPMGLTLQYQDPTNISSSAITVFKLHRPVGQYRWYFAGDNDANRSAMMLDNDHSITLYDPVDSTRKIVITPGPDSTAGITVNGHRLATTADVAAGYLPLGGSGITISSGNLGIGTTDPQAKLSIQTSGAGNVGLIVQSSGAATADLQQWRNASQDGDPLLAVHVTDQYAGLKWRSKGANFGQQAQITQAVDEFNTSASALYISSGDWSRVIFGTPGSNTPMWAVNFAHVMVLENVPSLSLRSDVDGFLGDGTSRISILSGGGDSANTILYPGNWDNYISGAMAAQNMRSLPFSEERRRTGLCKREGGRGAGAVRGWRRCARRIL